MLQAVLYASANCYSYLAGTQYVDAEFEDLYDQLVETTGFSSGLLPAAVVARSRSFGRIHSLLRVTGFRVAFWIACRSHLHCLNSGDGSTIDDGLSQEETLSLVIRGLSSSQVEERLSQYFDAYARSSLSAMHAPRVAPGIRYLQLQHCICVWSQERAH